MPNYSKSSKARLTEADERLQKVFNAVITFYDHNIECGYRGMFAQNLAYMTGASKTPWPKSKHNSKPSKAVDAYPFVNGKKTSNASACREFAGFVLGIAASMGIKLRWGGDWDGDHDPTDQTFNDLVHFEVVEE